MHSNRPKYWSNGSCIVWSFHRNVCIRWGARLHGVPSPACLWGSCGKQAKCLFHRVCQVSWQPCSFLKGGCMHWASDGLLPPRTREVETTDPRSLKMWMNTGGTWRLSKCQTILTDAWAYSKWTFILQRTLLSSIFSPIDPLGPGIHIFSLKSFPIKNRNTMPAGTTFFSYFLLNSVTNSVSLIF